MWLHYEVPGGHEFGEQGGITVQPTAGASTVPEAWMVDAENTLFIGCCDGERVLKRALGGVGGTAFSGKQCVYFSY